MTRTTLTVLAASLLLAASAFPAFAQVGSDPAAGRLHVVGRAILEVPPDFATVQVGVATRAPTAGGALSDNAAAATKVVDLAKAAGLAERDIQTSAVSLSQAFKPGPISGGGQQPDGFSALNGVSLKVREIGRLGDVLRRVVEGGANRIDGISFGLNDPGRVLADAQAAAVKDAVGRAGRMADAAGISLGPILRIEAPPRREPEFGSAGMATLRMAAPPPPVPIQGGAVAVEASVDVVFRLVQP